MKLAFLVAAYEVTTVAGAVPSQAAKVVTAMRNREITQKSIPVLVAIIARTAESGVSEVGYPRLCNDLDVSKVHACTSVRRLTDAGLINVARTAEHWSTLCSNEKSHRKVWPFWRLWSLGPTRTVLAKLDTKGCATTSMSRKSTRTPVFGD